LGRRERYEARETRNWTKHFESLAKKAFTCCEAIRRFEISIGRHVRLPISPTRDRSICQRQKLNVKLNVSATLLTDATILVYVGKVTMAANTAAAPTAPAAPASTRRTPHIVLLPGAFAGFCKTAREVGDNAVWRVSTAKHGNGVNQLRDDDDKTFWQSDGSQPHTISIQFHRLEALTHVAIFLQFEHDDSYTPHVISIRTGTHTNDVVEVASLHLESPSGWVLVALPAEPVEPTKPATLPQAGTGLALTIRDGNRFSQSSMDIAACVEAPAVAMYTAGLDRDRFVSPMPLYATHVQIRVVENFQNGRDCHVRGVKVFGPLTGSVYQAGYLESQIAFR
jgi:anaphase-promoting complex subunit 10